MIEFEGSEKKIEKLEVIPKSKIKKKKKKRPKQSQIENDGSKN